MRSRTLDDAELMPWRSPTSGPTSAAATAGRCCTPRSAACWAARSPGTAHAVRELRLHIERDADRTAVRGRPERLALASAIVKAASVASVPAGVALLAGDDTVARVRELLDDERALARGADGRPRRRAGRRPRGRRRRPGASGELGALSEPAAICGG